MMQKKNILDTDRIGWLLAKMTMPVLMGMFVQTLYNIVNTIFIGNFVGTLAIAGLSIVFPLQMLAWGIGMMIGMGGSSLISRAIGEGNIAKAERIAGNGMTLSIIVSLIMTGIVLFPVNFWLKLIGASDAVLPYARDYIIIIYSFTAVNVFGATLMNYIRSEGNTRITMISQMMGAVINIILDAVFIIYLKMGVRGAALGTVTAQTISTLFLLSYYVSGKSYLKIHRINLVPDLKILRPMFAIGSASFLQTVASSLSAMLIINLVVRYGGDTALSAFGIINRLMMFFTMPAMVIGQGSQPVIGFNFGAVRPRNLIRTIKLAAIASTSISLTAFLIIYSIPRPIISLFTNDLQLIEESVHVARLVFFALPLMGFVNLGNTIFQAIGKVAQSIVTALLRPVIFLVPAAAILSRLLKLDGVFLSFPVSDALACVLTLLLLIPIVKSFRDSEKMKAAAPAHTNAPGSFDIKINEVPQATE